MLCNKYRWVVILFQYSEECGEGSFKMISTSMVLMPRDKIHFQRKSQ